jgi:hypothetical protein
LQVVSTPKGKQFLYAKAGLATEYPLDKATGYGPGMVRGIVSIKRTL